MLCKSSKPVIISQSLFLSYVWELHHETLVPYFNVNRKCQKEDFVFKGTFVSDYIQEHAGE